MSYFKGYISTETLRTSKKVLDKYVEAKRLRALLLSRQEISAELYRRSREAVSDGLFFRAILMQQEAAEQSRADRFYRDGVES